jgi:hypothetical protein
MSGKQGLHICFVLSTPENTVLIEAVYILAFHSLKLYLIFTLQDKIDLNLFQPVLSFLLPSNNLLSRTTPTS